MTTLGADRVGGLVWFVGGAAILAGSWTMDRLDERSIHPLTAPGLLPGVLGIGMMALALVLLLRRAVPVEDGAEGAGIDRRKLATSFLLCVSYAGLLLGRGIPFPVLTAGFVFTHLLLVDDPERRARPPQRRAVEAGLIAAATSALVTLVFQQLFLVRLP
jgi:hypothetical protein